MKIKKLIRFLQKEDPEADVYLQFNGCTESGEQLDITNIDTNIIYKVPFDKYDEYPDRQWACPKPKTTYVYDSDYIVPEEDQLAKQKVVCLYSNRERYYPKFKKAKAK